MGWGVGESERFSDVLETKLQRRVLNIATLDNALATRTCLDTSDAKERKFRIS
jgi:hypothetical protein